MGINYFIILLSLSLGLWILYRPWIGVISIFVYQIFLSFGSEAVTTIEFGYMFLFMVTLLGWFVKNFILRRFHLVKSLIIPSVIIFVSYCVVSVILVVTKNIPFLYWFRQWQFFISLLLLLPIVTEFKSKIRLNILISTYLISATIISIFGIYNAFIKGTIFEHVSTGVFSTSYIWATILIIGLFGYLKTIKFRLALLVLLGINILRLLIDVSRLPVLAVILGSSIILLLTFIKKTPIKIRMRYVRISILTLIILSSMSYMGVSIISKAATSLSVRFSPYLLKGGFLNRYFQIKTITSESLKSPLFGRGFGYSFDKGFLIPRRFDSNKSYLIIKVHSLYLYLFYHAGLIGLGLYLLFLVSLFKEARFVLNQEIKGYEKGLILGLFADCIAIAVFAAFSVKGTRIEVQSFFALAGGIFILFKERISKRELLN